ncbi:hypothetical protein [Polycladidibacter stylochi]|uniref:hypothetical protein n=1 Tax=Polycladidibacter stylochi TaxID=1807766 RepID=UPI0008318BBC|nr:hypothetical protein [Pseudovibrio stylochi]
MTPKIHRSSAVLLMALFSLVVLIAPTVSSKANESLPLSVLSTEGENTANYSVFDGTLVDGNLVIAGLDICRGINPKIKGACTFPTGDVANDVTCWTCCAQHNGYKWNAYDAGTYCNK